MQKLTLNYEPKICKTNGESQPTHAGFIQLSCPTFSQRMSYLEKCEFKLDENGGLDVGLKQISSIAKAVDVTKHHYVQLELTNLATQEKVTSFEELEISPEYNDTLIEVAMLILNGFKPSKN